MTEQNRTFTWVDPTHAKEAAAGLTGLEVVRALRDGTIPPPPMAVLTNLSVVEVEPGRVLFTCSPGEEHYNPLGTVHGGLLCTLLDTVLGCAGHTTLDAGTGYTSLEIKVNYLRPVTVRTGVLTATGRVTKPGGRVIFTEGEVRDVAGKVVATASSSLLVLPAPASE